MKSLLFLIVFFLSLFHQARSCDDTLVYLFNRGAGAVLTAPPITIDGPPFLTLLSSPLNPQTSFCLVQTIPGIYQLQTADGLYLIQKQDISLDQYVFAFASDQSNAVQFNIDQLSDGMNYHIFSDKLYFESDAYNPKGNVIMFPQDGLYPDSRLEWQIYDFDESGSQYLFTPVLPDPIPSVLAHKMCKPFSLFSRATALYLNYPIGGGIANLIPRVISQDPLQFCTTSDGLITSYKAPLMVLQKLDTGTKLAFKESSTNNLVFTCSAEINNPFDYIFTTMDKKTLQTNWMGSIVVMGKALPNGDSRQEWQAIDNGYSLISIKGCP